MTTDRREAILELIQQQEIGTQEQLARLLQDMGYPVTQATVSRDIKKLMLTKVPAGEGGQKYARLVTDTPVGGKYVNVMKEGFISADVAGNMLVIKTVSGMAMAVAAALDDMHFAQVVGCIAGDDTVMAAIRSEEAAKELKTRLERMVRS